MVLDNKKHVEYLIVDTSAFIQNASLHEVAENIITCQDVVNEIINKRQLRRLVVLPYDLKIKDVFPENIQIVTEFAKKTGDYPSLSAADIKVMALTYQMEKEKVGTAHLRSEPVLPKAEVTTDKIVQEMCPDVSGFYLPGVTKSTDNTPIGDKDEVITNTEELDKELADKFKYLECSEELVNEKDCDEVLAPVEKNDEESYSEDSEDDNEGWITPSNVAVAKKQVNSQLIEDKNVTVACMTTDFAMQNVLRQMNLNVSALDGRIIKQLRTYILRCYACFKTTSVMTKKFCPKCGNNTLKKVAVSLDEEGKMKIHINPRKPLSGRGKRFSLPRIKGGKHPNNPILVEDQPMADNRPTRLARTKTNALDDDYIAGFSPFVMRDINSKSAQLCIRPGSEFKHWMRGNPNESRRRRK